MPAAAADIWHSVACFGHDWCGGAFSRYNDLSVVQEPSALSQLLEAGVDAPLARHLAHLFVRDSISLFSEKVHQDDTKEMDHFEVT